MSNIMEKIMNSFASKGKTSPVKPKNKKQAHRIALAIALNSKAPKGGK